MARAEIDSGDNEFLDILFLQNGQQIRDRSVLDPATGMDGAVPKART